MDELNRELLRRLRFAVIGIATVMVFGTLGYVLFGWSLLNAIYMTVITVTTVGYREIHPLSTGETIFTIGLVLTGTGTVFYGFGTVLEAMVAGQWMRMFGRQRLQKRIDALSGHYIICGFGRMGHFVCRELADQPLPFVAVEQDEHAIRQIEASGYLFVEGDSTDDDVLIRAGIDRASGLVSVLSTDADNLYVVMSARGLNPALTIISRYTEESAAKKLMRGGADRVIAPYRIGGNRIAQAILQPNVLDFIEIATVRGRMDVFMEEVVIEPSARLVGQTLRQADVRHHLGVIVIAIRSRDANMTFNPNPDQVFEVNDVLIVLGTKPALKQLETLCRPENAALRKAGGDPGSRRGRLN